MTRVDANQIGQEFGDTLERVSLGKERIVLQSRGQDVAVLIPIEDLPLLERFENLADIEAAEAAEAEAAAWLGETDRLRDRLAVEHGVFPDSTLDIAADRAR